MNISLMHQRTASITNHLGRRQKSMTFAVRCHFPTSHGASDISRTANGAKQYSGNSGAAVLRLGNQPKTRKAFMLAGNEVTTGQAMESEVHFRIDHGLQETHHLLNLGTFSSPCLFFSQRKPRHPRKKCLESRFWMILVATNTLKRNDDMFVMSKAVYIWLPLWYMSDLENKWCGRCGLPSRKLTWNLKMPPTNHQFLGFHVNLQGLMQVDFEMRNPSTFLSDM